LKAGIGTWNKGRSQNTGPQRLVSQR